MSVALTPSLVTNSQSNLQSHVVPISVASVIVKMLEEIGVKYAFGVSGGAIVPLWHALQHSSIRVLHFRHEAGAAFAATEAYFASGSPIVVFATIGPGITNAITGLFASSLGGCKGHFRIGFHLNISARTVGLPRNQCLYNAYHGDFYLRISVSLCDYRRI